MLTIDEIKNTVIKVGQKYHIKSAYLFGSYAKNQATEGSDVDLYVDSGLSGLRFVGFVENLRLALGSDVDVLDSTHINNNSKIQHEIAKTGVLLYER